MHFYIGRYSKDRRSSLLSLNSPTQIQVTTGHNFDIVTGFSGSLFLKYGGFLHRETWGMGSYAEADYNLTLSNCRLRP
jgi:hypothetical protein